MKQSLIASCPIAGIAKPKVVCGHLASQPYTTLGQGSRPTNLTKHAKVDPVFVSAELRHRGQLVSCKAESSGRGAPSSTKINVPQSKEESVSTRQIRAYRQYTVYDSDAYVKKLEPVALPLSDPGCLGG